MNEIIMTLTLEDELAREMTAPESPWKAMDIAEILAKIVERDAKIASQAA